MELLKSIISLIKTVEHLLLVIFFLVDRIAIETVPSLFSTSLHFFQVEESWFSDGELKFL